MGNTVESCCRAVCEPCHKFLCPVGYYRYVASRIGPSDQLWEHLQIPYVPSSIGIGTLDFENPLHISDQQRFEQHGKVFGTYEGQTPVIVMCNPLVIDDILESNSFTYRKVFICQHRMYDNMLSITQDIQQWKRIRILLFEPFRYANEDSRDIPLIVACASDVVRSLEMLGEDEVVDGGKEFGVFAMDLMCRIIFGKPSPEYRHRDNIFVQKAAKLITRKEEILRENVMYPGFRRVPKNCPYDPKEMYYFRRFIRRELQRRDRGSDLLQTLMDAVAANSLSRDELYAQCVMLIALSNPPVSMTMAVACWEISKNLDIQNRVKTEIDNCLTRHGGLGNAAVEDMKYLERVLKEAMRKYPAVARIERVCVRDVEIEGIHVNTGTVVAIPLFALHRNPAVHPHPLDFDPNRFSDAWNDEELAGYLPFGEGSRKCLASNFAMWEMKIFMACLFSQLELVPVDGSALSFSVKNNIMVPAVIPFKVRRREQTVWSLPPN